MKYKVWLQVNNTGGGSPDAAAITTFYTKAQAQSCAASWEEIGGALAYWWNGDTWARP